MRQETIRESPGASTAMQQCFPLQNMNWGTPLGLGHSSDRRDIMYPEYEQRDNINPILLSKYGPLLRAAAFVALVLLLFLGVSWQHSRKKRKTLEDKYFK